MPHRWNLRSISIIVLLVVLGLDIPSATLGWAASYSPSSSSFAKFSAYTTTFRSHIQRRIPTTIVSIGLSMSMSMSSTYNTIPSKSTSTFKVLGICGGIGSGKSTACKLLVDSCHCLAHIDADKVAHSVYAPGSQAVKEVVEIFGKEILLDNDTDNNTDNNNNNDDEKERPMEIDRKKLGAIVFAERSAMATLEAIVWPHVRDRLVDQIDELRESWKSNTSNTHTTPVVVLEAAILLDAGWDDLLDGAWTITVPKEHALARLVETRGLTREEATKRVTAQESRRGIGNLKDELEQGVVHCVVSNDGSLDDLEDSLRNSLDDPNCWKNF